MSDDSGRVPPSLTRLPHRIRFFASTAPSAEKETAMTPAVNGLKSPSNGVYRQENRPTYSTEISPSLLEQQVTPPAVTAIEVQAQRRNPNTVWKPGTFGFDSTADAAGTFQERMTIPMMVLKNIAAQQGQPAPTLQSEVSGAAGAAALVGVGNIGATVLKY